jgi:site-specific DNA recombinase
MSKRAIIYARVSSDEQRSNYSIPTQVKECMQYIESEGYSLLGDQWVNPVDGLDTTQGNGAVPAYVDDFTSLEISRSSLDAAIRFLDTTGFDVLVVYSLDRLARDPYIRRTLELELESRDARVDYVQGQYDDSPEGEVRKDLESIFAKWENSKRVERTSRGKRESARSGNFIAARAPYGYAKDENQSSGLAIDETQA